jgi:hypothetical protein
MRLRNRSGRVSEAKSSDGVPTSGPTACTDVRPNASIAFVMNAPIFCGAKRSSRPSDLPKPGRSIASTLNCFASPAHTEAKAKMLSGHGLRRTMRSLSLSLSLPLFA